MRDGEIVRKKKREIQNAGELKRERTDSRTSVEKRELKEELKREKDSDRKKASKR